MICAYAYIWILCIVYDSIFRLLIDPSDIPCLTQKSNILILTATDDRNLQKPLITEVVDCGVCASVGDVVCPFMDRRLWCAEDGRFRCCRRSIMQSATNDTADDEEGDKHGRKTVLDAHGYRVIRSLDKSQYATVKLAYSERHQANVAVKIISKERAPSDYIEKFLPREISIMRVLKHPNIVLFHQVTKQQLLRLLQCYYYCCCYFTSCMQQIGGRCDMCRNCRNCSWDPIPHRASPGLWGEPILLGTLHALVPYGRRCLCLVRAMRKQRRALYVIWRC